MQQIAVAMLDVHEVRARLARNLCGADVALDEFLDLIIRPHLAVAGDVELAVENRMPERHARLHAELVVRLAEAPRVRELETGDQIVRRAELLRMGALEDGDEFPQSRLVLLDDDELIRIGASVRTHRHRFATEDEFCAALAEPLPASAHFICDAAGRRAVPAFHRVNRPAVADALAVHGHPRHGLRERRITSNGDGILAREIQAERGDVIAEVSDRLERRDAGEFEGLVGAAHGVLMRFVGTDQARLHSAYCARTLPPQTPYQA